MIKYWVEADLVTLPSEKFNGSVMTKIEARCLRTVEVVTVVENRAKLDNHVLSILGEPGQENCVWNINIIKAEETNEYKHEMDSLYEALKGIRGAIGDYKYFDGLEPIPLIEDVLKGVGYGV